MKKTLLLCTTIVLLAVSCNQSTSSTNPTSNQNPTLPSATLTVANKQVQVEVAETNESRQHGLSGRDPLQENHGLLFNFTNTNNKRPGFWMKQMKFNIDIIWISENKIIQIDYDVQAPTSGTPDNQLPIYSPSADIDYVLEMNAGWAKQNGITVGDSAILNR